MKLNKFVLLVFSLLVLMTLSLSFASASDLTDIHSTEDVISDSGNSSLNILRQDSDDSITPHNEEYVDIVGSDNSCNKMKEFNTEMNDESLISDSSLNQIENKQTYSNNEFENSNMLTDDEAQMYLDNIIKNPSFNLNNGSYDQWIVEASSPALIEKNFQNNNLSHDGDNHSFVLFAGTLSQYMDFTVIDSINFYIIPADKITVVIGDDFAQMYSFDEEYRNDWNLITLDTTGFTGWQLFSISVTSYNHVYLDDFYVTCDGNNKANFTSELLNNNGDEYTVQFYDQSVGLISNWFWDFGDGSNSTERNPAHTYKTGIYNASLTVFGPNSNHTFAPVSYGPMNTRTGICYSSIQDAIENAMENDTILIRPLLNFECYKENLVVNKSLNLVFENCTLANNNTKSLFSLSKKVNLTIDGLNLKNIKTTISADKSSKIEFINSSFEACNLTLQANVDLINSVVNNSSNINLMNRIFSISNCSFDSKNTTIRDRTQMKVTNGILSIVNSRFSDDFTLSLLKSNLTLDESTLDKTQFSISQNSIIELSNTVIKNSSIINIVDSNISLINTNFNSSRYLVNNCNMAMENIEIFNNIYVFEITNSEGLLDNIVFKKNHDLNKGFNFKDSNISLRNSNLTECDIAINQTGGELNITNNFITNNNIGINIESGFSNIHYNTIYGNNQFGIVYRENSIDGINNWFGKNNPSFISASDKPSSYYDIVCLGSSTVNSCDPWIVLNLSTDSDLMAINTNYPFHVDLTRNSNGDYIDESNLDSIRTMIRDIVLNFKSDFGYCGSCNISNGKGNFDYYSGDEGTTQITFTLLNENYILPLTIDSTVPQITYITPSSIFNDTILVEIICDDPEAIIYYTLDATNPLNSSTRAIYNRPFTISKTTTLHVVACDKAGNIAKEDLNESKDISVTYMKSSDLTSSDAIWSQYQGDSNNTGISDYTGPLTNLTRWSNLNIVSSSSAVVDKDGLIYIASEDGYLYCLNSEGKVVWSYGTRSKIISSPAVGPNGHIYFANWENSTLYELDNNGYLKWKYELGNYNLGSSIKFGSDGTVYAISGNDSLTKVFAFKNQTLKWICEIQVPSSGTSPAIAEDGTLYLILKDSSVALINWDGTVKGYIKSKGIVNESASVSIGPDGLIYVLKTTVGTQPTVDIYYINGTAVVCDNRNLLRHQSVYGAPTFYKDKIYVLALENIFSGQNIIGRQGKIYAFDNTGSLLWNTNITNAGFSASSPIISSDEIMYFASNNTVYAFNLDGTMIWSYELTGKYGNPMVLSSPTLTDDGTLIVPTTQGIWAFNELSADFTYEYVNGTERGIKFNPITTAGNNTFYWRFGDYRYSSLESPIHEYFRSGNYTVYLAVNHSGVIMGSNKTIEVFTHDITPPEDVIATIGGKVAVDATYRGSQTVTMNSSDNWGEYAIYYTVDGSDPTTSSTRREYYEPVLIEANTYLQFSAVDPSGNWANVGKLNLTISDSIIVNETLVEKIQRMLDEAEPNSKIIINYENISGANFTINKPLNIISTNNSLLIGNGIDPVFTITSNASGTKINGFVLENTEDTILVNGTKNVSILNTIASSSLGAGFNILNSNNTVIKDSLSNDSYYGILVNGSQNTILNRVNVTDSYSSGIHVLNSNNTLINNSYLEGNAKYNEGHNSNILLNNSNKTKIINTYITEGYFGIRFSNTTNDVDIINNTIYETIGDGILFEGTINRVNVTLNTIDGSFNGLHFNAYVKNIVVTNNLVWHMDEHTGSPGRYDYDPILKADTYGQYENCVQISEGSKNFGNGVYMENNVFIKQNHRSWEARKTNDITSPTVTDWEKTQLLDSCVGHDYNLWDGSGSLYNTGGAVGYSEGRVNLVVDRIGDSTFRARLQNMRTGEFISDLDPFTITFTAGRYVQEVNFTNDSAIATFNTASSLTSVEAKISMHIYKSISWDIPITEGYNSSIKDKDPGRVEGDAYDNRHPSVAPMYETDDERAARIAAESTGDSAPGTGSGSGLGNGTGSGMGEGKNSGNGTGRATIKAGDNTMPGSSTDVSTVFSQSQSTGGDADSTTNPNAGGSSSAYELDELDDTVSKSISLDDPMKIALLILLSIFLAIGYYIARKNEWMK